MKGIVKWFRDDKGFGFIAGEDTKDYFAHQQQIWVNGYRTLVAGQEVYFIPKEDTKGRIYAAEIQPGAIPDQPSRSFRDSIVQKEG